MRPLLVLALLLCLAGCAGTLPLAPGSIVTSYPLSPTKADLELGFAEGAFECHQEGPCDVCVNITRHPQIITSHVAPVDHARTPETWVKSWRLPPGARLTLCADARVRL